MFFMKMEQYACIYIQFLYKCSEFFFIGNKNRLFFQSDVFLLFFFSVFYQFPWKNWFLVLLYLSLPRFPLFYTYLYIVSKPALPESFITWINVQMIKWEEKGF